MTEQARNTLLGLGVVLILLAASCAIKAQDREAQKEALRLEYSTFCRVVKRPPDKLAEAINGAIAQDPKTWMPIAAWWNAIHEHYVKAGCGET